MQRSITLIYDCLQSKFFKLIMSENQVTYFPKNSQHTVNKFLKYFKFLN